MNSIIPYIGGKHRAAREIAKRLHATGADTLVDVFGGSASVLLNAGFKKRIYNDASGDLVVFFQVLADDVNRRVLIRRLRYTPPSRQIFDQYHDLYIRGCFSLSLIKDPVERACAVFYRHCFSFGGKVHNGGFAVSTGNRHGIKEIVRYHNTLRRLISIGHFFRETMIEHKDYSKIISLYGVKPNVVLFVDPPYDGTERYYSMLFSRADHVFLAHQLSDCRAKVVCTYYDSPLIRELYPDNRWIWERIEATKNSQFRSGYKVKSEECILIRKEVPIR